MAQRSPKINQNSIKTLRLALRRSGASQQDIAEELGLSLTTVRRFFSGQPIQSSVFLKICQKLELDWQEFVDIENKYEENAARLSHVLHLSGLHFGTTDNARTWYAQLAEDLRYELGCSRLDTLIISGDIASKSTPDEYAAAQLFLNRLSQEFYLESQKIVIVPGNHDVNWQLAEAAYSIINTEYSQEGIEEYLTDENGEFIEGLDKEQYKQRFINFSRFYEVIKGEFYPLEYNQQYSLQHLPEQNLLILGLNSAWQIDHRRNKYRASINSEALSNALSLIRRNLAYEDCLKIAVWHHSLNSIFGDRITDSGVMERLATAGFRLVLHGGIHRNENNSYRYEYSTSGQQINIIGAGVFGASLQESGSHYPWQYNFLKIDSSKVTVETRRREDANGVWKPDLRWVQGTELNPLPRYVIPLTLENADDPKIYVELGKANAESGRYEEAIASLDKAIEFKPDFDEAWFDRGAALVNLERYEEAIASFDQAITIKTDFYQAWAYRGKTLTNLGRYEEAIASLDKAIEFKPDFYQAWIYRGKAAENSFNYSSTLVNTSIIARQNPHLNQRGYMGKLISYEEGLKYCQQDIHPEGWGILHQAIGDAHYLQGEKKSNYRAYSQKAVTEYYQALTTLTPETFPELHLEVIQNLIRALLAMGKTDEAETLKQHALDVLQRLLSAQISEFKKQQLRHQFVDSTHLTRIEPNNIIYSIFFHISQEVIPIGGEYEVTVFLIPNSFNQDNVYLLEISYNEAIGNELNIFITASGFQFNGNNSTSLPLDQETANIAQSATFNLTALRQGKTKIKVELYCGETYKTTLETEVEVTAFEETEVRPLIAARSRPVPQPDIILQVCTTWNADISACTFNYHIDSYQPRLLFADDVDYNSQSLSATWVERSHSLLKATLEEAATSLREDFRSRLVSLGHYLFQSLLPEELQNTFRTIASFNHPFTLLILADQDAWFPWELLHDGQKFLGDRFIIGRWLWELEKARPYEFPVGAVNVAHYANVEQPELWTELLQSSGAPPPISMQAGIFNDITLFESIRGLHLIRYGQSVDTTNRQDAPVRVNSSSDIQDIEREVQPAKLSLRRNHPLVSLSYLNAGQAELTALEQTWASTFVRAGCSAFVGSLWAVQPNVEAAFVSAFYHSIWAGQTLAAAFQTARRLAKTVVPESLDWLAYVLFGDPMARPYRPVQGQGYAVVEPIGQEIDDPVSPGSTVRFRVSLRRTPPVWYENRLMEVAEDLSFDDLRVFIVTSGLQVTPGDSILMTRTATGDYLGWFTLTAPAEMESRSVLVQVYFEDGIEPVHNLRFALNIVKQDGEAQ
ncbi:tetratricopeptide repeat protein [Nostoc linckia FACHB-104]|nr:tetratricopeptide repeat protein [Nostoc linckia FACHB-104]